MSQVIHVGASEAQPQDVGYDPQAIEKMDTLFQRLVTQEKLQAGSYLMARKGKVFACKSMGSLSGVADKGDLMPDSIRRIASITKVFTAIAVLQLVERGVLYLTQPVSAWIPEFDTSKHSAITITHLLTHTAGILADPGSFNEPYQRSWADFSNPDTWIKDILRGPLQAQPMQQWSYSSFGYRILGEIIARASGQSYESFVMENVVHKMGLQRTFFQVPPELHDQVCVVTEDDVKKAQSTGEAKVSAHRASGGIFSTLQDLATLGQMMLNKGEINGQRILGRKTVEAMTQNQLDNVPAYSWGANIAAYEMGLGWRVTSRNMFSSPGTFGHEGSGRCALYIDPVEDFVAVYFVPSPIGWVPESILGPFGAMWSGIC